MASPSEAIVDCNKIDGMHDDRISNLPDEILCQILSFLPTNYAVATIILSKRWKFLWKYITNIQFDHNMFDQIDSIGFYSCMYDVLKGLQIARIRNLSIKTGRYNTEFYNYIIENWICYAIELKVERVELLFSHSFIIIPRALFTEASTLVELKLSSQTLLANSRHGVSLPNLKILHLELRNWEVEIVQKLVEGCPVLDKLYIKSFSWLSEGVCIISSSSLTRLTLLLQCVEKLELNVPNLRYIRLKNKQCNELSVMGGFSNLIEADLDLCNDSVPESIFGREIIQGHLKHFNNVKTLTVSSSILKALSFAPLDAFAIFQNATHLKMKAELCNWHLLSYILERSINLQVLIFTKGTYNSKRSRERCWYEPRNVPKCVSSSLRLISIHGFQGLKDEIQMMKYFLENAQVLARLEINAASGARSRLYRKIKKVTQSSYEM